MDDTENYLNSILKKRLGSVVNYNGSSKSANTVTRIPKQEEKVENMPTVFRKKHQTVYLQQYGQNNSSNSSYYTQAQSQYMSMKQPQHLTRGVNNQQQDQQLKVVEDDIKNNRQQASQRVQYMLISKRIQSLKQEQPIMPTVDVTNYNRVNERPNRKDNSSVNSLGWQQNEQKIQYNGNNNVNIRSNNSNSQFSSRMSSNTGVNQSKRKRIFNSGSSNNIQ